MDTSSLKKFAQAARRQLIEQVAARMEQVLRTDSVEIREKAQAVEELKKQIAAASKGAVIDRVAYTWFNRFCALRFMDVNHYTSIGVVSPIEGHTQPEVLAEAKLGVIDDAFGLDKARVFDLLNGQYPSSNPQQEAYRLLLKGACNALNDQMPFLFPKIDDYTELLMPDDLLSENSVLQGVRETLTPAACEDVEVIGWLYQYYISERKDEVFAALKKNQKIEAEDIPAATQLFTPHWIVRYLVENSLGRLWLLNRPHSKLTAAMDYYIAPEQTETDFLQLGSPEEIKLADPACGSGHMLTYAFDLLYAIYEEEGYDSVEIPRLILEKNLYGIEIDERAGNLAAFALVMKARAKDRRFFRRKVEPNICVLENVYFSPSELDAYKKKVGNDLFTQDLWFLLTQFEQADNFGSLIRPQVKHPEQMLKRLEELG
ncbi:MAG: BREX-1 system adenine-specific DNA-methyltransferase PglX, partial [Anaerolineae bacterium]|nr:BREX-1 system adenine-specific DNA-methyltransferase PglX [Anaerolineae bacterium]